MRSARYVVLLGGAACVTADIVSTEVHCVTAIGPSPVSAVATVSSTTTLTLGDATTTTAVTDTITTAPTTETVTETEQVTVTQTEDTVTSTYTSTSTETETSTETVVQTETLTESVTETTTTTSTSTVPAPTSFLPIADTLAGYPAQKRRHVGHPRCKPKVSTTSSTAAPYQTTSTSSEDCGVQPVPSQYPQSVQCTETVTEQQTLTETTTSSTTVTPAPVTATSTETITSTSTEVPQAEVTETLTETTTSTVTTTSTQSTTVTETQTETATASAVAYAACAANNLLSSYQGMSIVNAYNNNNGNVGGGSIYDNAQAASAYDCCVLCLNTSGCTGTAFLAPSRCVLLRNSARTCNGQSSNPAVFITGNGAGYTLSNSACGYFKAPPA
ncbi:uncharacterized protein B0I36DRAFT_435195 [Microdochium trichocladiopsis]|uniref:Apple domain-containing protein n=1 Tax=Microdochium trichocladiopsis TaxID=1682393 RepID=A0A9P8XWR4_9PEZI|nr:uncharacterized protein B0I36DRAFT_435195 [Microdochium trichocladiopsis]KAH7021352.1 hypothetical protein B0I36DRAFT_435195 [Microdochium trichocladiopsis]